MAILTRDLCNEYGNIPLPPLGIKICLSAVKVLVAALKGTDSEEEGVVESNDKRNVMTKVAGTGVAERERGSEKGRESEENEYDENIQIQTHRYDRRIETIIEDIQDNTSDEMRCCEEVEWRRVGMGMEGLG